MEPTTIPNDTVILGTLGSGPKTMSELLAAFSLHPNQRHALRRILTRLRKAGQVVLGDDVRWGLTGPD